MTRRDRTAALGALYEDAAAEIDEAIRAMENCDKDRALAAMARVTGLMHEIGAAIADGPILPVLRVH